tara:strand:- start:34 stop:507 length:474 start_codon:yes stop_codon:yes gene_type:complete
MCLTKKQNLNLSSFIILFIFIFSSAYGSEKIIAIGKASVIDGDTIIIKGEKIRFAGIDTPERNKIGHNFSKKKLKEKIGNNIITCVREKNLDPWGRTVAECFIGYESISSYMVKNGYACDYVKYSKKKYAKEQEYAKSKKLGIWKMNFEVYWEKKCG